MKLLTIILFVFIAGCALVPQKFDSTEVMLFTEMQRDAKHLELACGNKAEMKTAIDKLFDDGEQASFYIHALGNADEADFLTPSLHLMEGVDSTVGETFCKETAINMQAAYGRIARTLSRREQ